MWPILLTINVATNDITRLHKHVVQRGTDSSGSDRVGVSGVPGDEDSVAVWIAQQAAQQTVSNPAIGVYWEQDKRQQEWPHPDVGRHGDQ